MPTTLWELSSTAYRPEAFRAVLGEGRSYGVRLLYAHEPAPLGTGGAIKNAERFIDGPAVICNGDILMDLDITTLGDLGIKDPTWKITTPCNVKGGSR